MTDTILPSDSNNPPTHQPSGWEKAGIFIGHMWKSLVSIPSDLIDLIMRVSSVVKNALFGSSEVPERPIQAKPGPASTPVSSVAYKVLDQIEGKSEDEVEGKPEDEEEDFGIASLFEEETQTEQPKARDGSSDPLSGMGAVAPMDNIEGSKSISSPPSSPALDKPQDSSETYSLIQAVVQSVQNLIREQKDPPATLDQYEILIRQLDDEYCLLKDYSKDLENEPKAKELITKMLSEIEEKMADLGMNLVHSAHLTLARVKKQNPEKIDEFWNCTAELVLEYDILKRFASKFENAALGVHALVQEALAGLERMKSVLDVCLCDQVKRDYEPNHEIPGRGNCLFESIRHQMGNQDGQEKYRQQAVAYLRNHRDEFAEGILDPMNIAQAWDSMERYGQTQDDWGKQLAAKLGREPEEIDYYLDCMENHPLWGGTIEICALSEVLQVPIVVFTRQDATKWRFDHVDGQSKYGDKNPLMLYYNGHNHYQDLIPKRTS